MENEPQFNLEAAIARWRCSLAQSSGLRDEELEELDLHLRDSVNLLQRGGLSQDEAWIIAQKRLGRREALKNEFAKITGPAKALESVWERFVAATQLSTPSGPRILQRIVLIERNIILPVKVVAIAIMLYSFYSSPWFTSVSSALEIGVATMQNLLWGYVAVSFISGVFVAAAKRLPLPFLQGLVFATIMMDGVFMLTFAILVGESGLLYWFFPALLVRGACSVPRFSSQVLLWFTLIACFVFANLIENGVAHYMENTDSFFAGHPVQNGSQPTFLRLALLLSVALCCWAAQTIYQRNDSKPPIAE